MQQRGLVELGPASAVRAIIVAAALIGAAAAWRCATRDPGRGSSMTHERIAGFAMLRRAVGGVQRHDATERGAVPAHGIGTAGRIVFVEAAPTGRWVVVCQERGGSMRPYVIRGEGEGQPVDGFVGSSPDGRWLATLRDDKLVVIDDVDGSEHRVAALDALVQDEELPTVQFASDSAHVLYVRTIAGARTAVIHDLARGQDRVVAIPRASVEDVDWTRGVDWVRLRLVRSEARIELPTSPEVRSERTRQSTCRDGPLGLLRAPPLPAFPPRWNATRWLKIDTAELRAKRPRLSRAAAARLDRKRTDDEIIHGSWSLAYDQGRYLLTDRATGRIERLPGVIGAAPRTAGSIAAIDTIVVDLAHPDVLGAVVRPPLAVDVDGRALLPANTAEDVELQGPLRWERPRPIATPEGPEPAKTSAAVEEPRAAMELVAVDGRGRPVQGAWVRIDAPKRLWTAFDEASRWRRYVAQRAAWLRESSDEPIYEMAMALPGLIDAQGRLRWSASRGAPETLTVLTPDGRLGAVEAPSLSAGRVQVELRPPGSLHVVCGGFRSQDVVGDIAVRLGWRTWRARCGGTIAGLPAGRYALLANVGGARVATADVELQGGDAVEAVLEVSPAAAIHGRLVEVPDARPVAGMSCQMMVPFGDRVVAWAEAAVADPDGRFTLFAPHFPVRVDCFAEDHAFAPAVARIDADDPATVLVRVVRPRKDAIDAGVDLRATPEGARITRVARRAWSAGLLPGDLVRAVDDIPLAGLSRIAMFVLAFEFPPTEAIRWTVQRGDRTLTILAPAW